VNRPYFSRWTDAVRAFCSTAHRVWVVVEDFHPVGRRIVARFDSYEAAIGWLEYNRRGRMRVWTLAEYRRRVVSEMEDPRHWVDLAEKTTQAWRGRDEAAVANMEAIAAVAAAHDENHSPRRLGIFNADGRMMRP